MGKSEEKPRSIVDDTTSIHNRLIEIEAERALAVAGQPEEEWLDDPWPPAADFLERAKRLTVARRTLVPAVPLTIRGRNGRQ